MSGGGERAGAAPVLLVLRYHALGDVITAQPALHALRRAFPRHRLTVTCPSWHVTLARFLLGRGVRFVTEGSTSTDPSRHIDLDSALLTRVRRHVLSADIIVVLRPPGPELAPVIAALAPRRLISYRHPSLPTKPADPEFDFSDHILVRWERLLSPAGIAPDPDDLYCRRLPPGQEEGHTILHCGAGSAARRWPEAWWIGLARSLARSGHRILLTGSAGEAEMVGRVAESAGLPRGSVRAGTHSSLALAGLVARARLVISTDTGIAHVATAFRRPAVTLYGPVAPSAWGPPPGNPQHRCLWAGREGEAYGTTTDSGLLEIGVDDVLGEIAGLTALAA